MPAGAANTSTSKAIEDRLEQLSDNAIISARTFKEVIGLVLPALPIAGEGARVYESAHGRVIDFPAAS